MPEKAQRSVPPLPRSTWYCCCCTRSAAVWTRLRGGGRGEHAAWVRRRTRQSTGEQSTLVLLHVDQRRCWPGWRARVDEASGQSEQVVERTLGWRGGGLPGPHSQAARRPPLQPRTPPVLRGPQHSSSARSVAARQERTKGRQRSHGSRTAPGGACLGGPPVQGRGGARKCCDRPITSKAGGRHDGQPHHQVLRRPSVTPDGAARRCVRSLTCRPVKGSAPGPLPKSFFHTMPPAARARRPREARAAGEEVARQWLCGTPMQRHPQLGSAALLEPPHPTPPFKQNAAQRHSLL